MAEKFFGVQKKFGDMQGGSLVDGRAGKQEDSINADPAGPIDTDGSGGKDGDARNIGKEAVQKNSSKKGSK